MPNHDSTGRYVCPTNKYAPATREAAPGGAAGYAAAYTLAGHLPTLAPDDCHDEDAWCELIEAELVPTIDSGDPAVVAAWSRSHLPRIATQVLPRRWTTFLAILTPVAAGEEPNPTAR